MTTQTDVGVGLPIREQLEKLLAAFAANNGVTLVRRGLASEEELAAVACPIHGRVACWDELNGTELPGSCIYRHVAALRADYLPPRNAAACGSTGEDGCE